MKYIAKENTWFKAGMEVELIDDYRPYMDAGLFRGIRVTENPLAEGGYPQGIEREDEEICGFDEFDAIEERGK